MTEQRSTELFTRVATPVGKLLLVGQQQGTSVALCGLYFEDARHADQAVVEGALEERQAFAEVLEQLAAYFAGKRRSFELKLAPRGTEFQRRVWQALAAIPYGETTTYAAIARAIGKPKAVRAVGAANGKNPISIVVPCHRVIGKNRQLTGYAGGLERKQ
ncbi:MAG TPA: methylated-DNA--[protein]-cysteine S-methyltransferase, partial [Polyangiaceae bacterium]|nr:methylated-DNA--[protein]-cysteine S-methyltransferase [Polyangiaceae bacterium]